jgi:hypothetical protein
MRVNIKRGTLLGAMTALAVGVFGGAGPASAGLLVQSATDCPDQAFSQPFAPFHDGASYTPVRDGGLENGADDWDLNGNARVVSGNESWHVGGARDDSSLRIPSGSSAETPPLCVGLEHPTLRFFAKKNSGLLSVLAVSAVVHLNGGGKLAVPIGVVVAGGSWTPTVPYLYLGNALAILAGNSTPMSFRFTPVLGGDWQIDDVYVDPFRKA